ncbi:hypothetical protein [Actinomadura rudentiformis]|uniref:Uncharacterized protein n=1 Tax=Actinomadura rudentiformis TaxID=359158 RepID=A0A6H9YM17_9ACTN|nr:hypothetical protein [Actinomadura rudentiformis]KAB2340606.1 hypothetical protein F8566_44605 [Actinomadura rudentiformis]
MPDISFQTDRRTRWRLRKVHAGLNEQLRPVDCQTCGRPLSGEPALVVYSLGGDRAEATLHHPECHQAGWYDEMAEPYALQGHLTWRASTFTLPAALGAAVGAPAVDLPVFLVNPSYEAALLCRDKGGWRLCTLRTYAELGLSLEMLPSLDEPNPILSAHIDGDRITVTMQSPGDRVRQWSNIPLAPSVADLVRQRESIVVAVTTLVDMSQPMELMQAWMLTVAGGLSAVGVAALR